MARRHDIGAPHARGPAQLCTRGRSWTYQSTRQSAISAQLAPPPVAPAAFDRSHHGFDLGRFLGDIGARRVRASCVIMPFKGQPLRIDRRDPDTCAPRGRHWPASECMQRLPGMRRCSTTLTTTGWATRTTCPRSTRQRALLSLRTSSRASKSCWRSSSRHRRPCADCVYAPL